MSRFKVVVTDYVFASFDLEKEVLQAADAALEVCQCKSVAELEPHLAGAHALLNTYLAGIDRRVFERAPALRVVVRYGIGLDTINLADATACGVMVANVPDYCVEEVSTHALAHFLCLARKILLSDRRIRDGQWSLAYVKPMPSVAEMTAGIIGFGRIGRAIAQRLRPLVARIVFHDPNVPDGTDNCQAVTLDDLCRACDVIFIQCPATPQTRHLVDRTLLEKMQRRPLLINTARGDIVDTDALVWALEAGRISGAGLDVLENEAALAQPDHPLRKFVNVSLTPHSAWYSEAAIRKLQRKAAEEVVRVLRGDRPLALVNPQVLERSRK